MVRTAARRAGPAGADSTRPFSPDGPLLWNEIDLVRYRDRTPRFASEFGWQAPPSWATLTEAVHDEPLTPTSPPSRSSPERVAFACQSSPGKGSTFTLRLPVP